MVGGPVEVEVEVGHRDCKATDRSELRSNAGY